MKKPALTVDLLVDEKTMLAEAEPDSDQAIDERILAIVEEAYPDHEVKVGERFSSMRHAVDTYKEPGDNDSERLFIAEIPHMYRDSASDVDKPFAPDLVLAQIGEVASDVQRVILLHGKRGNAESFGGRVMHQEGNERVKQLGLPTIEYVGGRQNLAKAVNGELQGLLEEIRAE